MKPYLQKIQTYVANHRNEVTITGALVVMVLILVALFIYDTVPHYAYQPVKACDLLTPAKAQDLLDDKVIGTDANTPVVSGDTATSKCSYSDENADKNQMKVAAVAVRSAVDDKGVQQNKADFMTAREANDIQVVTGVGESAYFNKTSGQLNVLSGHVWLIISYGIGATPQNNDLSEAVKLARDLLSTPAIHKA